MNDIYQMNNMRMPTEIDPDYVEYDYGDDIPLASMANENEIVVHREVNGNSMNYVPSDGARLEPEVSASAIAALMGGRINEAKAQQYNNVEESMTNIPTNALEMLMGGKINEAKKINASATRKRISEDELFDTNRLLKERAEQSSRTPVRESVVIPNDNVGVSEARLEQLIEAKVMKVLQRISGLNESEKKQDEIMMVIGDSIFSGKLVKIGKMKK